MMFGLPSMMVGLVICVSHFKMVWYVTGHAFFFGSAADKDVNVVNQSFCGTQSLTKPDLKSSTLPNHILVTCCVCVCVCVVIDRLVDCDFHIVQKFLIYVSPCTQEIPVRGFTALSGTGWNVPAKVDQDSWRREGLQVPWSLMGVSENDVMWVTQK